jgi:uncharacterized protein (UPF0332 family)
MPFDYNHCIRQGLLRKIPPSKGKAIQSLNKARDKLDKKWVELLDYSREIRHNDQYDLSFFSTREEAENALKSANDFFIAMESLFKTKR